MFTLSTKYSTCIIEYYWLLSHVGFKSFLIGLGRWKHVNVKWLVTLNGCWWLLEENFSSWVFMQTLMDGSANISVFSIITVETLWWQKLTNHPSACCIERHCLWHIVSRSLCIVRGVRKKGNKKLNDFVWGESSLISLPDDGSSLFLGATRGIRLEKCDHSSHKRYRQTDGVTADVQKLLSRQIGEGTASVCQHVALRQSWLSECK